jgi:GNAT superfamily N-acetyltransferase
MICLDESALIHRGLAVRPIAPEDEEFLYRLYASAREEELSVVDWDEPTKEAFLRVQFTAQHQFYHQSFVKPEFLVVLRHDQEIGRIYIDRRPQELCLAEITLLPDYRGQGIGSIFIQQLMAEAEQTNLPLRLHVEHFNRARHLYERLQFHIVEQGDVYLQMEWRPQSRVISQNSVGPNSIGQHSTQPDSTGV